MTFIIGWVALYCFLFKQQYVVTASVALFLITSIPATVFWFQGLVDRYGGPTPSAVGVLVFIIILKILQFIGNRRARSIFKLNHDATEKVYSGLRDSFPVFASLTTPKLQPLTRCCFFARHRRHSFCMTLAAPLVDSNDNTNTNAPPSWPQSTGIVDVDSFFSTREIGQQQLLQTYASFESLIRDAEFINFAFQEWVSSWLSNGPDIDKIKRYLYKSVDGVDVSDGVDASDGVDLSLRGLSIKLDALPINGTHIRGPVKHVDRSLQKVGIKRHTL